jgi:ERCC4-related helicase
MELWPSQLEAAKRATDLTDDLVIALPASAGKTRIAELCILCTLASGKRVVYVMPHHTGARQYSAKRTNFLDSDCRRVSANLMAESTKNGRIYQYLTVREPLPYTWPETEDRPRNALMN